MNRWIFGNKRGLPVISPELVAQKRRTLVFLDFVQSLAIRRIRLEHPRISLQTIRDAYFRARDEFHKPYPFAVDSTRIGLFGNPKDPKKQVIWLCIGEDEDGTQRYFQLTGKKHHNQLIGEVVRTYAQRLVFDDTTKLAKRFSAFPTVANAPEYIVMDPLQRFGEPFLNPAVTRQEHLFDARVSEGSPQRVADIYGVKLEQVELASEYFDYLKPAIAA